MGHKEHDAVILVRDLPEHALRAGDLGAVVHVYSPGSFAVEFVRASGQTQALVTVMDADLRAVREGDLIAVRQVDPPSR